MSVRDMVMVSLFTALLAVGSQLFIPIGPVPFTIQIIVILLTGQVLGKKLGALSVTLWVLLGILGIPVFSEGKSGAAVLWGPTGGFIFGFIACSWLVGHLRDALLSYWRTFVVMVLGLTVNYVMGYIGFMLSFHYVLHKPMSMLNALSIAVLPFIPLDLAKTVVAAYLGVKIGKALTRAGLALENKRV